MTDPMLDMLDQRVRFGAREAERLMGEGMTEDDAVKAVTRRAMAGATPEELDALAGRELVARLQQHADAEVAAGRRRRVVHDDGHVSYPRVATS